MNLTDWQAIYSLRRSIHSKLARSQLARIFRHLRGAFGLPATREGIALRGVRMRQQRLPMRSGLVAGRAFDRTIQGGRDRCDNLFEICQDRASLPLMRVGKWPRSVTLLTLTALVVMAWLRLPSPAARPVSPQLASPSRLVTLPSLPIFADFDGDHQPDQAELGSQGAYKSIHVSLTSTANSYLYFDSHTSESGRLLAADIDHDLDTDLIWISTIEPLTAVVWLNNGQGHFTMAEETEPFASELRSLQSEDGKSDLSEGGGSGFSTDCSLAPTWTIPTLAYRFEIGLLPSQPVAGVERRPGCALCLTCQHERAPPPDLS